MSNTLKHEDLFFQEGNSDKEYHLQLVMTPSGYNVECQWGRRGSTLQTQTKMFDASLEEAQKVYDKVLGEKIGKGYHSEEGQKSTYVAAKPTTEAPETDNQATIPLKRKVLWDGVQKMIPQLLNMIEESEVEKYLKDDAWGMQEKKNGKHVMIRQADGAVTVFNKKGKEIGYPKNWADALSVTCTLDGEAIGETFHTFDLLEVLEENYRDRGYGDRHARLSTMSFGESIRVVPLAVGYAAKKALFDKLMMEKKEGVVFKRLSAVYTPGRPSSGGDMVKFKFYATASVQVCQGREGKHSVAMEVLDGKKWVGVGNVTVGQATALPEIGSIIEVRYLYAHLGGSLYQPTYLGPRDDVDAQECVIGQLKYKPEED